MTPGGVVKYGIPFPTKGTDGKANPKYMRCWLLVHKKGMPVQAAIDHMKAENEVGHVIKVATPVDVLANRRKKPVSKDPSSVLSPKIHSAQKPAKPPKQRKPAPVKWNGAGAVAVSGEDLLGDPRVPEAVKDQIRLAESVEKILSDTCESVRKCGSEKEMHVPSQDSGVSHADRDKGNVSHHTHTDSPQRPNTFHQPKPLPVPETVTYTPPATAQVNLAPIENCLSNIAVCLSEICDKLDTVNQNLAKRKV